MAYCEGVLSFDQFKEKLISYQSINNQNNEKLDQMRLLNFDDTEQIPNLPKEEVFSEILTAKNFDVDFEKMPLY